MKHYFWHWFFMKKIESLSRPIWGGEHIRIHSYICSRCKIQFIAQEKYPIKKEVEEVERPHLGGYIGEYLE